MYIVKGLYIKTGKVRYIGAYETAEDAIEKIISCYKIDERIDLLGAYYYFWTKH